MKIGLVGPSYVQRSLPFSAQRTINLFPVLDQSGKDVASLYGTSGLHAFTNCGAGPVRGAFRSTNGRVFCVSGASLYEVLSSGSSVVRGSLMGSAGTVSMCEGLTQLAICDGDKVYYLTYSTNDFSVLASANLPAKLGYISNIDGYFILSEEGTGRFYKSAINNVEFWAALDYATAESSPDKLIAPVSAVGQLWMFGEITTEIWTNTGASSFPFARISGAIMQAGLLAKHTAIELDNSVFWVGRDKIGSGIVMRANGFTPQRVSTEAIERRVNDSTDSENMVAWSYQEEGHVFYVLTGGGLETSLVYDLSTKQWHERAFLNSFGNFEQHLGSCHVFAFGKHLIGSRLDGSVYEMSQSFYDDAGEEIVRERTYTHLFDEGKRYRYNTLEIGLETGVGLTSGQGSNPLVSLQLSKDGARTWSSWFTAGVGKLGEYLTKVRFRRLGVAEQMTFRIRVTDKVKVAITGSYLL